MSFQQKFNVPVNPFERMTLLHGNGDRRHNQPCHIIKILPVWRLGYGLWAGRPVFNSQQGQ